MDEDAEEEEEEEEPEDGKFSGVCVKCWIDGTVLRCGSCRLLYHETCLPPQPPQPADAPPGPPIPPTCEECKGHKTCFSCHNEVGSEQTWACVVQGCGRVYHTTCAKDLDNM